MRIDAFKLLAVGLIEKDNLEVHIVDADVAVSNEDSHFSLVLVGLHGEKLTDRGKVISRFC
jgi:hypothetical protein